MHFKNILLIGTPTSRKQYLNDCIIFNSLIFFLYAKLLLTVCNPMDCILPDSSVYRIFQARILDWVAIPFSRGSFQPRDQMRVSYVSCIGRQLLYH